MTYAMLRCNTHHAGVFALSDNFALNFAPTGNVGLFSRFDPLIRLAKAFFTAREEN